MRQAEAEGRAHAKGGAKVGQDKGPPGRPKPDKQAPGPEGRNPIPEKLPGR